MKFPPPPFCPSPESETSCPVHAGASAAGNVVGSGVGGIGNGAGRSTHGTSNGMAGDSPPTQTPTSGTPDHIRPARRAIVDQRVKRITHVTHHPSRRQHRPAAAPNRATPACARCPPRIPTTARPHDATVPRPRPNTPPRDAPDQDDADPRDQTDTPPHSAPRPRPA